MKKRFKVILSACLVFALVLVLFFYFCGKKTLTLHTRNGDVHYRVETALTQKDQQKGLMDRKHMAAKNGMIFVFNPPRVANMWMKNTFIPLDMVFFDYMGRVVRVHHNAIPHDETIISSVVPVAGVLEINAGEAKKYGIAPGTKLDLSNFK